MQTDALLKNSVAVDAGNNGLLPAGLDTDARGFGFPRIVGAAVDIGAFELQPPVLFTLSPDNALEGSGPLVVVITGTGLSTLATVDFGGVILTPTSVIQDKITVSVPLAALNQDVSVNVTVINPDGSGVPGQVVVSNALVFTLSEPAQLPLNYVDQTNNEGDVVSVTAANLDPDAIDFMATGLPPGLGIDNLMGLITGTIDARAAGVYAVTITATDDGTSGTANFNWTVADTTPPAVTSPGDQTSTAGDTISLPIVTVDGESFTATNLPPSLSIDPVTGIISGVIDTTGQGTYAVSVTASDGGVDTTINFTWLVKPINSSPSFTSGPDQTPLENSGSQPLQVVRPWATNISAGPPSDAGQTLTFIVTNDNNTLFAVQPTIDAVGTLSYKTAVGTVGTATVTVYLMDDGGTANGGVDTFGPKRFRITVIPVNEAPSFTAGPDQAPIENGGSQPLQVVTPWATNIKAGPPNESAQTLTFIVTNNNNGLFAVQPSIDAAGTLTYQTKLLTVGTATVTVKLRDNGGTANGGSDTSAAQTFRITVTPVNQSPSFTGGPDQNPLENGGSQPLQSVGNWATNISKGTPNESGQKVNFVVTDDNNALFAVQPTIDPTGTLTYQTAVFAVGSSTVTVFLKDDGGTANGGVDTFGPVTFRITVIPVNQPPSFTAGPDQAPIENGGSQPLQVVKPWATSISAGPPNESGQTVHFVVFDDNASLFAVPPSIDPAGTLTYKTAVFAVGTSTVTVRLVDDGGTTNGGVDTSATQTFKITVTAVNQPPTFTAGPDQAPVENRGAQPLQTVAPWATNILAGPPLESGQKVNFIVANDNNALFAVQPSIDAAGTLTYQTAPFGLGIANVTVKLMDDGGTANGGMDTSATSTFRITVTLVNQPPTFTPGSDQMALENAGSQLLQVVQPWATSISPGRPAESSQKLQFLVSNDNPALFGVQPSIDPSGTLTYQTAVFTRGTATVTVRLMDDGGTANGGVDTSTPATFHITVIPVNQAPSFTVGPDQKPFENRGSQPVQVVANWARNVSAGPANEASQKLTFAVTNDNNALFAVQPTIDAAGTLTYQIAVGALGGATVTAVLKDDGGTANGGQNTSTAAQFHITVVPVNTAPSFTGGPDQMATVYDTKTVPHWATNIAAGRPAEAAQTLTFQVTAANPALFSVQPSITADGTLTYQVAGIAGQTRVTVLLRDNAGTANGGQDTSTPFTFTVTTNPVVITGSADALWVSQAYRNLLKREARPEEVSYWTNKLDSTLTRFSVAQQMTRSDEFQTLYVRNLYTTYLHRPLDESGRLFYLGLFRQGATTEEIKARFFTSDEYVNLNGGGTLGLLNGIYRDALNQSLDDAGRNLWSTKLAQGESAYNVALEILSTRAADNLVVQQGYPLYLSRPADAGAGDWLNALQGGTRDEDFYAKLTSSAEIGLSSSASNYDGQPDLKWLSKVYQDTLGRAIDATGRDSFVVQIRSGARRGDITSAIVGSGEYRGAFVQGLAITYLGHPLDGASANGYVQMIVNGSTNEEVKAVFLQSDEYFAAQQKNGNGNYGFLVGVFRDVLGGPLDEASRVTWGTKLAQGESRHDVALEILNSANGRSHLVVAAYQKLLNRAASGDDVTFWTNTLLSGLTDNAFTATVLGSHEYYVKAST